MKLCWAPCPVLSFLKEHIYRGYRALAERYDHLSTELQNANNTIASVFPEKMPYSVEDEDEDAAPKTQPRAHKGNIPKVPKIPGTQLKQGPSSTTIVHLRHEAEEEGVVPLLCASGSA